MYSEQLRLCYEHLMCDAFNCGNYDYIFTHANNYDGAYKHLEATKAYVLCALINLKQKGTKVEVLQSLIDNISDNDDFDLNALDEVLISLSNNFIVF